MSFLSKLFGPKYDDDRLESHARDAIHNDPIISDPESLTVAGEKGIITLRGRVKSIKEKDRIEGVIRDALRNAGLKYESIVNDLTDANGSS